MEIQRIRLKRFTWPIKNSIHKNNDADGKLQKVSGRRLILSSDVFSLRTSKKVRQTQFMEKTQLLFQVCNIAPVTQLVAAECI